MDTNGKKQIILKQKIASNNINNKIKLKKECLDLKKECIDKNLLLIDGSFFCFYRYGATCVWFCKHTKKGVEEDCHVENEEFMKYYNSQFNSCIENIKKRFKNCDILWVADTPQTDIWRHEHVEGYKGNRGVMNPFISAIIKHCYDNLIPKNRLIKIDTAEADDCIGIISKYEANKWDIVGGSGEDIDIKRKIYIISGDSDLFQLVGENVKVINPINNKMLECSEVCMKIGKEKVILNATEYIKMKVLVGDKTDNITPIYKGCGTTMALKLIRDPVLFKKEVLNNADRNAIYERNRTLIDFDYIPRNIGEVILKKYLEIMDK